MNKALSNYSKMHEMPEFIDYRSRRILEICEYLTPIMNEIHDTNYSFRFWATLLKEYVKTCINRENHMSEKIIDDPAILLPYNGWELPTTIDRWKIRIRYVANVLLKNTPINMVFDTIKNNKHICVGQRADYFEENGIGAHCPDHFPLCLNFLGKAKRKRAFTLAQREDSIFLKNVVRRLPRFYLECFDQMTTKIKLIDPEEKTFHAEHISDFMELLIALYVENGAEYYRYQYGGFVGETRQSVAEDRYIDIDRLRTYGWKINEKDEPYKAIRLEQFRDKYKQNHTEPDFDLAIVYKQLVTQERKKRYKRLSEVFFREIDSNKYPDILLRPRGFTKKKDNSGELDYILKPPFVTVDQGKKPMSDIVKKARLVVHFNHPSTNFLECVYVDHPVVALLTNDFPTEIIKPFYRFFIEEKVMHENIESLISHLNVVDLDIWWKNIVQKPMYKKFKEKFARKV